MKCPKCKEGTAVVKETRPSKSGLRRRRQCDLCEHKFTTYEMTDENLLEIGSMLEGYSFELSVAIMKPLLKPAKQREFESLLELSNFPPENWPNLAKTLRVALGLTQIELSRKVNYSEFMISALERNESVSYTAAIHILEALVRLCQEERAQSSQTGDTQRSENVEGADPRSPQASRT